MQWQNNQNGVLAVMLRNLTFNSFIWIFLGLISFVGGAYFAYKWRFFGFTLLTMPIGFVLVGIAMMMCGLTNGFTDHTPLGRKIKKIGAFLFIVGIPPIAYVAYYYF